MDDFKFYEKKHFYTLNGKALDGVTSVLNVIAKTSLVPWAARMACDYVREHSNGSPEGIFSVTEACLVEAQKAHRKKKEEGGDKGKEIHANVETWIGICLSQNQGKPLRVSNGVEETIAPFCTWAHENVDRFLASEQMVYSKSLGLAGTFDLLFEKDGKKFVGDIKTYKKIWDRTPMFQCAAYALMHEEMTGDKIDGYCVINLPKERKFNEEDDVKWSYDIEGDTKAFMAALTLHRALKNWT